MVAMVQANCCDAPGDRRVRPGRSIHRINSASGATSCGKSMLRVGFLSALVERSAGIGIMMIHVLVLGIGSHMAFTDELTIGSLASFQALFLTLSVSLLYVMQYVPSVALASSGMKRVKSCSRSSRR